MRKAVIVIVLALHVGFFFLFAVLHGPLRRFKESQSPLIAFFLPLNETRAAPEVAPVRPASSATQRKRPPPKPSVARSSTASAPPQPESQPITPTPPDWQAELQIAANNQLENARKKPLQPSVLAPHDFSGVKPGSTDDSRPEFGWSYAATHRIEGSPTGGLLININDRCAIAWVIFPFPVCRIGKIPVRGDLFDHMKEAPEAHR